MEISPPEKRRHAAGREKNEGLQTKPKLLTLHGRLILQCIPEEKCGTTRSLIFLSPRTRVLLALLSLRKNGGLPVVYGEVRKMGNAILFPKVTPKVHPFCWTHGIEISRVALGTRMGKLRFSTDFTLSIPLCLCVVTAFFPEGLEYTRLQVTGMHDRMGAKIHTPKIPRASRKTKKFLGPILTPKKSHAEFLSLKNFQKTKH